MIILHPFSIFVEIANLYSDIQEANRELIRKEIREKKIEKEIKKQKAREEEYRKWKIATEESLKNPDEWMILPYGWSPFGITL